MKNTNKRNDEFMQKVLKAYSEYERFKHNTLKKLEEKSALFDAITHEIPTSRKSTPGLIEKYFKDCLFHCAEEVSIQGNYMKKAYNECMKYLSYYNETQIISLNEYPEIKDRANEFIDKVREYFYNYEQGKVPFPKVTYTK